MHRMCWYALREVCTKFEPISNTLVRGLEICFPFGLNFASINQGTQVITSHTPHRSLLWPLRKAIYSGTSSSTTIPVV